MKIPLTASHVIGAYRKIVTTHDRIHRLLVLALADGFFLGILAAILKVSPTNKTINL